MLFKVTEPKLKQWGQKRKIRKLIVNGLKSKDQNIRKLANDILIMIGEPAIEELDSWLNGDCYYMTTLRTDIARILGTIGGKRSIDSLIRATAHKLEETIQSVAVMVLRSIKDKYMLAETLVSALDWQDTDKNLKTRQNIEAILRDIAESQMEDIFAKAACSGYYSKRIIAVKILRKIVTAKSISSVIGLLTSTVKEVRNNAVLILEKLNWKPETDEQRAVYYIAKGDVDKCAFLPSATYHLITAIDNYLWEEVDDKQTILKAIETLGLIGNERAMYAIRSYSRPGFRVEERILAIKILGDHRFSEAVDELIKYLKDYDVRIRREAIIALKLIGDPKSMMYMRLSGIDDNGNPIR